MSIFSKIIAGDLPASFVWQDDICVAFMDIGPVSPGHTLVVPRTEVATLAQLDQSTRAHLWEIANRIALAQQEGLSSKAQHFLVNDGKYASQSVPHVHIHVIPRYGRDQLHTARRAAWHLLTLAFPKRISDAKRRELDLQAQAIAKAMPSPHV